MQRQQSATYLKVNGGSGLSQVQTTVEHLALLLTRAEAAMLALTPTTDDHSGGPRT